MSAALSDLPDGLEGASTVTVRCRVADEVPEACDGWEADVELDGEPYLNDDDRVVLPGYRPECKECGNPHDFEINGEWLMWGI